MSQVLSSYPLFGPVSSWPYALLKHMEAGHYLDVGAAKGVMSRRMAQGNPASKITAYEPFPGNWPLFEKHVGDLANVSLIRKAVSDRAGQFGLHVGCVVDGDQPGWEDSLGYSSSGRVVSSGLTGALDIETVRLDEEGFEHIRFLKTDTQGHELQVIHGCEGLLERNAIDMILIEFDGDDFDLLDILFTHGFICFDTGFVVTSDTPDHENWNIVRTNRLSNGHAIFAGWPHDYPRSPEHFCDWLREQRSTHGFTWTDLLFVAPHFKSSFFAAASRYVR